MKTKRNIIDCLNHYHNLFVITTTTTTTITQFQYNLVAVV